MIKLDKREDLVGARDQVARDDVPVPFLAFLKPRILRKAQGEKNGVFLQLYVMKLFFFGYLC